MVGETIVVPDAETAPIPLSITIPVAPTISHDNVTESPRLIDGDDDVNVPLGCGASIDPVTTPDDPLAATRMLFRYKSTDPVVDHVALETSPSAIFDGESEISNDDILNKLQKITFRNKDDINKIITSSSGNG